MNGHSRLPGPYCQVDKWLDLEMGTMGSIATGIPGPVYDEDPDWITPEDLQGIAAPTVSASEVAHCLNLGVEAAGITTEVGEAMFIAQTAHETGRYLKLEEGGGSTVYNAVTKQLKSFAEYQKQAAFGKIDPNDKVFDYFTYMYDMTSPNPHQRKHAKDGLGNTQAGDGVKFKGRGYLQITGRNNYAAAGTALGLPLVEHPELAATPVVAAKVAGWFWKANGLNPYSQVDNEIDFKKVSYIINVGSLPRKKTPDYSKINGLADRLHLYALAKRALCVDD